MQDKTTRIVRAKAVAGNEQASRSPAGQTTITLRLTRAESKPIERVKRWEQRSASKVTSLTD
jgi:hypothetical protein